MLGHYISPKLTTIATTRHTQQARIEKLIKDRWKKFVLNASYKLPSSSLAALNSETAIGSSHFRVK